MEQRRYISIETGDYPVFRNDIAAAVYPLAIPQELDDDQAAAIGFRLVHQTEPPAAGDGERAAEVAPVQIDGVWVQQWEIEQAPVAPDPVPQILTRAQAIAALILAGLDELVEPAIESIADPVQRKLALNDWRNRATFERTNPTLLALADRLGLSDEQLDNLFRVGTTL